MSIQPPSDIILDVARAADPARLQLGASKLQADTNSIGAFDTFIKAAGRQAEPSGASPRLTAPTDRMTSIMPHGASNSTRQTYQAFEAFLLQTMIGSMLPAKAEQSYGKGTAGSVWKSMMAEHLANGIAKAGGVGIARMLVNAAATRANAATHSPGEV